MAVCQRLAALSPGVALQFKRVLNTLGLATFDRAVDEEPRAKVRLGRPAPGESNPP
jgi:hypothetical protein